MATTLAVSNKTLLVSEGKGEHVLENGPASLDATIKTFITAHSTGNTGAANSLNHCGLLELQQSFTSGIVERLTAAKKDLFPSAWTAGMQPLSPSQEAQLNNRSSKLSEGKKRTPTEKDLVDIPKKVREDIKIIPVESADEVLKIALIKELKPVEWTEVEKISESKKDDKSQASIQ